MSASLKLYTKGLMEVISAITASSEASGTSKWYSCNDDLDNYWAPSSASACTIVFDFGLAKSLSALTLFIRNYAAFTGNIVVAWSDDGADFSNYVVALVAAGDATSPMRMYNWAAVSHRYWRLAFTTQNVAVQLAHVGFGTYFSITKGNEAPENETDNFEHFISKGQSGRQFVAPSSRYSYKIIPRSYFFFDSTNYNALRNAWIDSGGTRWPLVLQEGSTNAEALLVKFVNDEFPKGLQQKDIYKLSVGFQEVPYIRVGDYY